MWRHTMHGPTGTDYPSESVFTEVVEHERIVFSHSGAKKGGPEAIFQSTWTFEAQGDKTTLTVRMIFPTAAARDENVKAYRSIEGAKQTFARLEERLAELPVGALTVREIVITRVFDAPRELVFKAWTDPKRLAQWWGPKGFTNPVCEVDARVGGAWHMVMRAPDGNEYPSGGTYREIVEPERLVFTNNAVDKDGKAIIEGLTIVTFAQDGAKTKLTLRTRGAVMVPYAIPYLKGMQVGWTQSVERLAAEVSTH
jgi:uncharacterized protein YndB with AHSA1/START domain